MSNPQSERAPNTPSRCAFLAAFALLLVPPAAVADVLWSWQFGTESGQFITDGAFVDTAGAFSFTFVDFEVTTSSLTANVGATYFDQNPVSSFLWDGSQPTQFSRADGALTNGSNFENAANGFFYVFGVTTQPIGLLFDAEESELTRGDLTIIPLRNVGLAVPTVGRMPLIALVVLLALVAARRLRGRQSA